MTPLDLVLAAIVTIAGSCAVALGLTRRPAVASSAAIVGALLGGAAGATAAVWVIATGRVLETRAAWGVPGGALVVGIDPLSATFLLPLFLIGALSAVYGRSYMGPRVAPALQLNVLLVTMAVVLIARHGLLLLVAWEAMTLAGYLLIAIHHEQADVRRAGWAYLVAAHGAVAALLALVLGLASRAGGSLGFAEIATAWTGTEASAGLLTLAIVGFGVKAGVIGLHAWLPEAHSAAPSHVSALMSAVLIKLGLYGILRTALLVPSTSGFGVALMTLGIAGALFGIALALGQRDLKRVLAYSSIENMGIILLAFGLGFWARSSGDAALAALAFGGGILHIWNHAAMKGLMFLGAGSVVHATGSRDVERLGGLAGRMRWTGRALILGSIAIAGLPPLNGFVSEWLLYRGLSEVARTAGTPTNLAAMSGMAGLALAGGLAALCFVRLVGVVLLGTPRSAAASAAHESPRAMTMPLGVLGVVCVLIAVAAPWLLPGLTPVVAQLQAGDGSGLELAGQLLDPIARTNLTLLLLLGGLAAIIARGSVPARTDTWGCGYPSPTPRMQYTGEAFSEYLSARVLPRWLRTRWRVEPPRGLFPAAAAITGRRADPITRTVYEPMLGAAGDGFERLRFLQQGNLHVYLLYVLVALVGGLAWVALRDGAIR